MARSTSLAAAILLLSFCGCIDPLADTSSGGPPRPASRGVDAEQGGFGYASVGYIVHGDFFGEIEGLDPGSGVSLTLPIPPWLFVVAAVVVVSDGDIDLDVEIEGDPEDVWSSGFADPGRRILSEFSINLTMSRTRHRDELGGHLVYDAVALGARIAGQRWRPLRPYVDVGYGWYVLDYESLARSDADIGGPYLGVGLEVFVMERISLTFDARAHLYFGEDVAGELVEGGARQFSAGITAYW